MKAFEAAITAADAERSTSAVFEYDGTSLAIGGTALAVAAPDIVVIGIGKAAPGMVRAVCAVTGAHRGIVVSDHEEPCPLPVMVGGHPVPDARSYRAGAALVREIASIHPTDVLVACVSGGGSAVAEQPRSGVTEADITAMNEVLIRSGLPIDEMNAIRACVSGIKAGHLVDGLVVRAAWTVVIEDVVSGGAPVVASGPTIASDLGSRAQAIIEGSGLRSQLPPAVVAAASRWSRATTPPSMVTVTAAGSEMAARAAAAAIDDGRVVVVPEAVTGDVGTAVESFIAGSPDRTVIGFGETSVHVTSPRPGGRNQHAALIAARLLAGSDRVFGALATDGRDGTTDAAGAIVDGTTWGRIQRSGIDADAAIRDFAAHDALDAVGATVVTGPTGTNVADLWVCG
jgi:hydroxypyruvate reductase